MLPRSRKKSFSNSFDFAFSYFHVDPKAVAATPTSRSVVILFFEVAP